MYLQSYIDKTLRDALSDQLEFTQLISFNCIAYIGIRMYLPEYSCRNYSFVFLGKRYEYAYIIDIF